MRRIFRLEQSHDLIAKRNLVPLKTLIVSSNDLAASLSLFKHICRRFFDDPARRNEPDS
jgi:hypothetical protein